MATAEYGGWGFVRVKDSYRFEYIEHRDNDSVAGGRIRILEDLSDDKHYRFKVSMHCGAWQCDPIFQIEREKVWIELPVTQDGPYKGYKAAGHCKICYDNMQIYDDYAAVNELNRPR